jgi:hypothetical protein
VTRFIDAAFGYPTAIYTSLLGIVVGYWVLALVGLVDFESGGIDIEADLAPDADGADLGTLATYVVGLGLSGVPFSIVISLLVLVSWTLTCLASMWLLPWVPSAVGAAVAGTATLALAAALAVIVTARLVRPMRGLFVTHAATANASLVGQTCQVLTGSVDEHVGRAEVRQRGAGLNIRVWSPSPNALKRGARARIVHYDEATARYHIEAEPAQDTDT